MALALFLFYFSDVSFFRDLDKTLGFWGITVTAVALVITSFFVVLALEAYKQAQKAADQWESVEEKEKSLVELRKSLDEANKSITELQESFGGTQKFVKESITELQESITESQESQTIFAKSAWASYTLQLMSLGTTENADVAAELRHSRGKLGYLFPLLDVETRMQCFSDLAKDGTEEDIVLLRKIVDNKSESEEIRKIALGTIEAILLRTWNQQSDGDMATNEFSLSEEDKDSLDLYVVQLKILLQSPVAKGKTLRTRISVHQKDDGTTEINESADLFDEHYFNFFMDIFRQMTLPNEKINFEKVCNVIWNHCNREEIKKIVRFSRKQWNAILDSRLAIKFIGFDGINESTTQRQLLELWMYAGIFHTDIDKTKNWNSLPQDVKNNLNMLIQSIANSLIAPLVNVGNAINWWLYEQNVEVPTVPEIM